MHDILQILFDYLLIVAPAITVIELISLLYIKEKGK